MRRLPDGEMTESTEEYLDKWQELAKPIEEATGYSLYGFDPTFSFSNGTHIAQLPYDFVKCLSEALKEYEKILEEQFKMQYDHCSTKFKLGHCPSHCDIHPCPDVEEYGSCEICGKEGGH